MEKRGSRLEGEGKKGEEEKKKGGVNGGKKREK